MCMSPVPNLNSPRDSRLAEDSGPAPQGAVFTTVFLKSPRLVGVCSQREFATLGALILSRMSEIRLQDHARHSNARLPTHVHVALLLALQTVLWPDRPGCVRGRRAGQVSG